MPPSRKKAANMAPKYGYSTGSMKNISHVSFVACGGFGEVHQVCTYINERILMLKMKNETTQEVWTPCHASLIAVVCEEDNPAVGRCGDKKGD